MKATDLYYSLDGSIFNTDDLTELDLEDGQTYWQGERVDIKPSSLVDDYVAAQVIERMNEALFDMVGDMSEDRLHISDCEEKELLQIIRKWADKRATLSCWKVENAKEMTFSKGYEAGKL